MHQTELEEVAERHESRKSSSGINMYLSEIKRHDLYHDIMHICFTYLDILLILIEDTT